MVNQQLLGVLFGISAGAIWAIEAILAKILFQSLSFLQVTASEVFFAMLVCLFYVVGRRQYVSLTLSDVKNVLVLGIIGTVLAPLLYFLGLSQTLAINATLIAHLQPLFVSHFSYYFLGERLQRYDYLAGSLVLIAVILIVGRSAENLLALRLGTIGDVMVFFAMLSWAIVAIPGKQLTRHVNSIIIVFLRFMVASCILFPTLVMLNQLVITSILQILLGALSSVGYILYYEGLKRIKASQIALTELSAPFFAIVFAWYFLGEVATLLQSIGITLLFIGLYLITRSPGLNKSTNSHRSKTSRIL